jgi:hypothetical protein
VFDTGIVIFIDERFDNNENFVNVGADKVIEFVQDAVDDFNE